MNTIIEGFMQNAFPLFAGILSCISSILIGVLSKYTQGIIEKDKNTNLKIIVNDQEMIIEGDSAEELLKLLSKIESKNQTQN